MTFRVGQKVVCVDDVGSFELLKGTVYTIARITPAERCCWRGVTRVSIGIVLVEAAPNPEHEDFAPERFRPAVERKTDISIFKRMLTPQGVDA